MTAEAMEVAGLNVPPGDGQHLPLQRPRASYWSVRVGDRIVHDAAWSYEQPLPEWPRIKSHLSFYPERVDRLAVEGEPASG